MLLFVEEFRKIISNKILWGFLAAILMINICFSFFIFGGSNAGTRKVDPVTYREVYSEIENMDIEEARDYLISNSDKHEYGIILEEVNESYNYRNYVEQVIDNAKELLDSPIIKASGKYSIRNQKKVIKDYTERLENAEVAFGPAKALDSLYNSEMMDLLCCIMVVIIASLIISSERDSGEIRFYKTTYNGKTELFRSKYFVLVLLAVLIWLLFSLTNILLSGIMYGFGDLSRPIQSVGLFESCIYNLSVGSFLICFVLIKLLVAVLVASIVYFIAILAKTNLLMYAEVTVLFGVEIILFRVISESSSYSFFKFVNIFGFLKTGELLVYRNINIFGAPMSYIRVFFYFSVLLIIALYALSLVIFTKQVENTDTQNSRIGFPDLFSKSNSIFMGECYKLFVDGKGLIVLALFIAITVVGHKPVWEEFYITIDPYEEAYIDLLEGPVDEDKLEVLEKELQRFEQIEEDYLDNKISDDEYEIKMKGKAAFDNIYYIKAEYLKANGGYFIHETGYSILTGKGSFALKDIQMAFFASVILIYLFSYLYGIEYQNETDVFLRTSKRGKMPTFGVKFGLGFIVTAIVYLVTYLPLYWEVLSRYGTDNIHAPANSLFNLKELPVDISLLEYLIAVAVVRFIAYLLVMLFLFGISKCTKSVIVNCILGLLVVCLPLALRYIGIDFMKYIMFNPLLLGNVFG